MTGVALLIHLFVKVPSWRKQRRSLSSGAPRKIRRGIFSNGTREKLNHEYSITIYNNIVCIVLLIFCLVSPLFFGLFPTHCTYHIVYHTHHTYIGASHYYYLQLGEFLCCFSGPLERYSWLGAQTRIVGFGVVIPFPYNSSKLGFVIRVAVSSLEDRIRIDYCHC